MKRVKFLAISVVSAALVFGGAVVLAPSDAGAQNAPPPPVVQPGMQRLPRGMGHGRPPGLPRGRPGMQPPPPPVPRASAETHPPDERAEDHGEKKDEHHKLLDFNFADFGNKEVTPYAALLINFFLLVGMYYLLGKKGVADGLKKRRDSIAKEIEDAQRILKEAEARAKTYQAKLKNLEAEIAAAKMSLEEAGKGERDRIVREAKEKAERMKRDASFLVEQEIKQMREDLTREAVELAVVAAEQALKSRVNADDHERLSRDFLADLGKAPAVTGGAS